MEITNSTALKHKFIPDKLHLFFYILNEITKCVFLAASFDSGDDKEVDQISAGAKRSLSAELHN